MTTRSFALVIVHQRRPSKERLSAHQPTTAQGDLQTTLTHLLTRTGGFEHLMIGSVNLAFLGSLLLESIPVIVLGSLLSRQIRDD